MPDRLEGRVRFVEAQLARNADDSLAARVTLAPAESREVIGTSERQPGDAADLWCVAEATVGALREILDIGEDVLAVRDVVSFDIAENPAVAVSLKSAVGGEQRKLFGLCQAEQDRSRAAALAVLSATNRFFAGG